MTTIETSSGILDLLKAIHKCQIELGHINKDAENTFQGFQYTSAENMIATCREVMHRNGVVALVKANRVEPIASADTEKLNVTILFHVVHMESGASIERPFSMVACQGKGHPMDKAIASVMTTGWSYFLRDLFCIPRFDAEEIAARNAGTFNPDKAVGAKRVLPALNTANAKASLVKLVMDWTKQTSDKAARKLVPSLLAALNVERDEDGKYVESGIVQAFPKIAAGFASYPGEAGFIAFLQKLKESADATTDGGVNK
jgi:hypothetical protein